MAPCKMPMIIWNMTTFPIERLCFDLKLKVLEELDAEDVIELVKVNQGFQCIISSRPSIAFGHYVHEIEFEFGPFNSHEIEAIYIKRLNGDSLKIPLDVIRHFPLIKNIRSCDQLLMCREYYRPIDKDHAAFLRQLEAVNSLDLKDYSPDCLESLSHLSIKIKIKRYAGLPSCYVGAPSSKELVGHFIEAPLNECQIVEFDCWDDEVFQFYYNASKKTQIKSVGFGCRFIVPAIQRIVSLGIPSKNPAAVVRVFDDCVDYRKATIVVFLTGYPGMKQINGKNRQPLFALAMERSMGSRYLVLTTQTLCFRRNINATRDCIYLLSSRKIRQASEIDFFAFYIKPDEIIDH